MKTILIILIGFLSFTVNAADNKPTPASKCSKPDKGCSSNTIDAVCSKIACRAKGCNEDYTSGDCKTLKDLHKASCELASSKCGENLPNIYYPNNAIIFNTEPMKMAPIKPLSKTKQPPAKAGGFESPTESRDTRRLNDASRVQP